MIPGQLLKFGKAYFSFWNNRSHLRLVLFFRVIVSEIEGSDRLKLFGSPCHLHFTLSDLYDCTCVWCGVNVAVCASDT